MMLESINRRLAVKQTLYQLMRDPAVSGSPDSGDDTVNAGIAVGPTLRHQLQLVQAKYNLSSYRHAIYMCMRFGARILLEQM